MTDLVVAVVVAMVLGALGAGLAIGYECGRDDTAHPAPEYPRAAHPYRPVDQLWIEVEYWRMLSDLEQARPLRLAGTGELAVLYGRPYPELIA